MNQNDLKNLTIENARYLLDIASQISGDTMTFILEDPGAPALINDSAHEDATYVLMPMRV